MLTSADACTVSGEARQVGIGQLDEREAGGDARAGGGDCLADIAVLRAEPDLFGLVASDPTMSRTIARLAQDALAALSVMIPVQPSQIAR